MKKSPELTAYLSTIGAAGGRIGGRAAGARKKRSAAHYRAMVKARCRHVWLQDYGHSMEQSTCERCGKVYGEVKARLAKAGKAEK